jgi:hypothetical protein
MNLTVTAEVIERQVIGIVEADDFYVTDIDMILQEISL